MTKKKQKTALGSEGQSAGSDEKSLEFQKFEDALKNILKFSKKPASVKKK